jgi:hypothetical protein
VNEQPSPLDLRIMESLRAAREPLREAVLHERVNAREPVGAPLFLAALERLATLGHVRVSVEHDRPLRHDPEPFEPRYWRVVD